MYVQGEHQISGRQPEPSSVTRPLSGLPAMLNVLGMFFAVESPRWLYAHGQTDKAAAIIARFHSRDNDINSPIVKLSIAEIEESISLNGSDKVSSKLLPMHFSLPRLPNRVSHITRLVVLITIAKLTYASYSGSGISKILSAQRLIGTDWGKQHFPNLNGIISREKVHEFTFFLATFARLHFTLLHVHSIPLIAFDGEGALP